MTACLWWVGELLCEWGCQCLKFLKGNNFYYLNFTDFYNLQWCYLFLFSIIFPPTHPPPPSPTLEFGAAVLALVILTVGGAVFHLRDADQELAVVPEHRHGQFSSALLHQVLGLQQGQIFCRDAIDLMSKNDTNIPLMNSESNRGVFNTLTYIFQPDLHLENKVSLLQCAFLCCQACFCHVLDKDLTAQFQAVLCRKRKIRIWRLKWALWKKRGVWIIH